MTPFCPNELIFSFSIKRPFHDLLSCGFPFEKAPQQFLATLASSHLLDNAPEDFLRIQVRLLLEKWFAVLVDPLEGTVRHDLILRAFLFNQNVK